ncbi:MAG TPA: hypothetical protein VGK67_02595 [Myxococcales bacterium]|jgi:hypothetical protein
MEPTPFLRPTSLQQMRGFLAESDAVLPPWSSADEVMDGLAALLHERRGDDAFFARLAPFLEELRDNAARGKSALAARDAELLSQATVESMVRELRDSLGRAPSGAAPSIIRRLVGERAVPLLCLALLTSGLSGCTQPADPTSAAGEPGTPAATPVRPSAPVGAEPAAAAAAAEPGTPTPPTAKQIEGGTDALVEMFKTKSPQEAAQELEKAIDAGRPQPKEQPKRKPNQNFGANSVALYKGVNLA